MKIGIMQPYFFPYIGYWQLMNRVDRYVIYDDVNYINRGWINRNRILFNGEIRYFNLPVLGASQNKLINQIAVNHDEKLLHRNMSILKQAYQKSPYYSEIQPMIEQILFSGKQNVAAFNAESFFYINRYLGIETELIFSSSLKKDNTLKGQDKILAICQELGATEYCNAIGGRDLYSYEKFKEQGIQLTFLKPNTIVYRQFENEFQPNLSIIDVMMFNRKEIIQEYLQQYTLIEEDDQIGER